MKLGKIWILLATTLIIVLSVIMKSSIIQIVAAVFGTIYVFSVALESRVGQLVGVVHSLLYGIIMYSNGVYGTAIYDLIYCAPMQLYTFFAWGKKKQGKDKVVVSRYTKAQRALIVLVLILTILIYCIIATKLNIQFALIDGISIILGVVGLYMTSKKKIEQWFCYIISNISMICLWTVKSIEDTSNIPMVVMWLIYIASNLYGLYRWNKKAKLLAKNEENI